MREGIECRVGICWSLRPGLLFSEEKICVFCPAKIGLLFESCRYVRVSTCM